MPVQVKECASLLVSVSFVELGDQVRAHLHQFVIFRRRLLRVGQIGHDRKVNVLVVIPEIAHFQLFDEMMYLRLTEQQSGNRN